MDRIAQSGLRYTNFHSTSLCSPSRAALITGRNHHVAGFGVVGEIATGFPGYDSVIRKENGTIGAILKENGYATSWFGKNHNTPFYQATPAGPFDQWPNGMGFEYFYGFVGGDTSQWQPNLFRNTTPIFPFQGNPGWNLTTAMADEAIHYMRELKEIAPDKPFLVYYVPGGTHSPHHPTPEWIKKISDMHLFDGGWNKVRETIFANQKRLGIMPSNAQLTPWPKDLPKWDSLGVEEKTLFIKQADVFGAYLAYTDHEIGRVIQAVEDMGQLDNTLIIYIAGDNGASSEGMINGTPNEFTTFNGVPVPVKDQYLWYPFWGSERTFPHFAAAWSWAMNTPFKWTKQVASHFGGTAQGVAVSWPGHIDEPGGIRRQFHHLIDIAPTILEATGIPLPDTVDGIKQRPMDGVSMAYTWSKANANAPSRHTTQYFEMLGNRAIYHDGWIAATTPATIPWELSTKPAPDVITGYNWELYNVGDLQSVDPTENNDLAAKMPEKLKQMQDLFYAEAKKFDVLPLDNYVASALELAAPEPDGGTQGLHLFGRTDQRSQQRRAEHPEQVVHDHRRGHDSRRRRGRHDRHRRRALRRLRPVPQQGRAGLRPGQAGLPLQPARSQAHDLGGARARARASTPSSSTSRPTDPGLGKGGTGVLSVDGKEVARNTMEHTTPITFPEDETFDIGQDTRTPLALIEYRYDPPFKFTGKINKVTFNLGDEKLTAEEQEVVHKAPRAGARCSSDRKPRAMKRVLAFAAIAEAATGAALLVVPSLVGHLLLGAELTGVALPVARVAGIALIALGRRLLAGPAADRHADLRRGGHRCFSPMSGLTGGGRRPAVAGGRSARTPDGTSGSGRRDKRRADE